MYTNHELPVTIIRTTPRPRTAPSLRRSDVAPAVVLPHRVDVHRVDAVVETLTAATACSDGSPVDVDGSAVEMIDGFGLAALERFIAHAPLVIRDASVALAKTAEYTGHPHLRAACEPTLALEMAA